MDFVIYEWGLSHMGSAKIPLVFFKYGLGFVTYGVKKDSFGFCLIWVGFVTYGVSKDTFGFCQIWVGFFHLSGQRRYTRDFSNMAWVLSLMGCRRTQFSLVIYGWGLSWVLSYMGSIQQQQLFMNSGRLG